MNTYYKTTLIFILIFSLFFGITSYAQTASELEQNIKDRTAELQKLEQEAARIRTELSKVGSEKATLNRELSLINAERKSIENNISQTRNKISLLGSEIKKTEGEIQNHNKTLTEQSLFLADILRRFHQDDSISPIEQLFSTKSLTEIFRFKDNYWSLQKPITKFTSEIKVQKKILAESKIELAEKQTLLAEESEKLVDQKSIVVEQEQKKTTVLNATKNKESTYQKNLNKTLETIKNLDAEIRDYESKLKFILDKKSIPEKGSAVFAWPLDYVFVTQRFGRTVSSERLYVSGSHSGTDFRAATGTPVYAVADGVIKGTGDTDQACPNASFGKWVFIEHPNGLSTTYGHLSLIKVSAGQKVKQGDLIAYSGNTGHSTAPHLHLTVYATKGVNGEAGARITERPSSACAGKTYTMPLAPTSAYLDPLAYLPALGPESFKHN